MTADLDLTVVDDDQQEFSSQQQETPSCDDADRYMEDDVNVNNAGKSYTDQEDYINGNVPRLQVGQTLEGYIAICDDWDLFGFELEEGKYYRIDFLGSSTGDGTLGDPGILAFFTNGPDSDSYGPGAEPVWYRYSDGKRPFSVHDDTNRQIDTVWVDPDAERQDNWQPLTEGNNPGGTGNNAAQYLMHFPAGTYYVALVGNGYTFGTYRIRLTEVADDDSGIRALTLGDQTTASLDFVGDKDVFELDAQCREDL